MNDVFPKYNAMPRYVVSTTMTEVDPGWPAEILRSLDEVAALKETEGESIIVHGSAKLGQSLADAGLVDRYHILQFPLLLGAGKRLFGETSMDTRKLRLVEHDVYSNGIQKQIFDVIR
jgi:dihydrofolate reductase